MIVIFIDHFHPRQSLLPSIFRYGAERLILVGDPRQLPATVLSPTAAKFGLERSLFERLEEAG